MATVDEHDGLPDNVISLDAVRRDPDRDGVAAMRDTDAEAGDEQELADLFSLDRAEAQEAGVDLDPVGDEAPLT